MMPGEASARFLMCSPDHFGVTYAINPWMDPKSWACNDHVLTATSHREWPALRDTLLELGATIELVPPAPGLPDLVFTANAAVVLDHKALLARFRHPERQREEDHFEAAFRALQQRGLIDVVRKLPDYLVLEGAGDCVWDQRRNLFWMGHGPRSDAAACDVIEDVFDSEVIALKLADPRFYHMDTALCPLPHGEVMFVPSAFTRQGKATICERVERSQCPS
jgi:N-dimethylarginine dimethylaminohydrolase